METTSKHVRTPYYQAVLQLGIDLKVISSRFVTDIQVLNNQTTLFTFNTQLSESKTYSAEFVILATGHWQNIPDPFYQNTHGYFQEIYCSKNLEDIRQHIIDNQVKHIFIRGLSLGAFDLIRWITYELPEVKILAFSRNDLFPLIRGKISLYTPEFFTLANLKLLNQNQQLFTIESIVSAFCKEVIRPMVE